MKYYIFIQNNQMNGAGQCPIITEGFQNIEVTEEVYNKYNEDHDYYIWTGTEIIENPEYEEVKRQEREAEFNKKFFATSLGYVRRTVSMMNGTTKDFLTDLLPVLQVGLQIPLYQAPDFTKEVTENDILATQHMEAVTAEFKVECANQIAIDFFGYVPEPPVIPTEKIEEPVDNEEEIEYNEEVEETEGEEI